MLHIEKPSSMEVVNMIANSVLPLSDHEGTPMYDAIRKALVHLIKNKDIHLLTPHEKIIGYLCDKANAVSEATNLPIM